MIKKTTALLILLATPAAAGPINHMGNPAQNWWQRQRLEEYHHPEALQQGGAIPQDSYYVNPNVRPVDPCAYGCPLDDSWSTRQQRTYGGDE